MTCCACFRADVLLDVALEVHRAMKTGCVRAAGFPVSARLSRQSDAFSVFPELHDKAPLCEVTGRTWTPAVPSKGSRQRRRKGSLSFALQDDLSDLAQEAEPAGVFVAASTSVRAPACRYRVSICPAAEDEDCSICWLILGQQQARPLEPLQSC